MKIAKIIKIIDDYTIVINQGETDNVKIGDLFLVYEIGEELYDPDTKESLGKLEIVKGKGKVVHAQEKISTIESIEIKKTRSIRKPIKTFAQFIGEEETYDSEKVPFKDLKLQDFVKKIR
jgi:translation initiation factor 2 gamma subunit (eIF-2gamma)